MRLNVGAPEKHLEGKARWQIRKAVHAIPDAAGS
jgi:hypothetical protein